MNKPFAASLCFSFVVGMCATRLLFGVDPWPWPIFWASLGAAGAVLWFVAYRRSLK